MATYILQVSGHGEDQGRGRFPVAKNMRYKFFVPMGQVLDYPTSEEIYEDFVANDLPAVDAKVTNTYFEGALIDDYVLWDLQDPNYVSGVLQAGSTDPVVDIEGVTYQQPVTLTNLLALATMKLGIRVGIDNVTVYFNACRT
jgi:hypothetical protein